VIPVLYSPKMIADSKSFSPSAAKPAQVVESWKRQFPIYIIEPTPVTVEELMRAHDAQFVRDILACKRDNGFGNKSRAVAESLLYTSGAMLSAAQHVLKHGGAAAAPCSGFHHAEHKLAQGFCTFNGLMVTALALHAEGVKRIGIIDLDMHYGNGTDDIIAKTKVRYWCGMLGQPWVRHFTGGQFFTDPRQAPEFFERALPGVLQDMISPWFQGAACDIVLYQAGADPHINDPHGGWLTTEQLRLRDAMVFEALAKAKIPVVWNLAGGYQIEPDGSIPKVLEIHDNTMRECARVYVTQ
jgi:acetoin utilization deacetylase AcuC-like enzyme